MPIDLTQFKLSNVIDTCSVWNIVSSKMLFQCAMHSRITFVCTEFVIYECLLKPRKSKNSEEEELLKRLRITLDKREMMRVSMTVDDLHQLATNPEYKRLGMGEMSSIYYAHKVNIAVMTDDQKARNIGLNWLKAESIQTTPHLVGWLIYTNNIGSSELDSIIKEHESLGRPLTRHFKSVYEKACECLLRHRAEQA